jgi:HSP20 family molecular chaperone IbpA
MNKEVSINRNKVNRPAAWNPFWPATTGFLRPGFFPGNVFLPWQNMMGSFMKFSPLSWPEAATVPNVDIVENGKSVKVKTDLPGLAAEDIDLTLSDHSLTIAGEKQEDRAEDEGNYLRRECLYGAFSRTVPLPEGVDTGKAIATFDDNVLTIEIPKAAGSSGKTGGMTRIPVEGEKKSKRRNGGEHEHRKRQRAGA